MKKLQYLESGLRTFLIFYILGRISCQKDSQPLLKFISAAQATGIYSYRLRMFVCGQLLVSSSTSAQLLDQFTYIFKFLNVSFSWDPYTVVTIKSHEPLIIEWTTIIGRGLHTLLVSLSVKPGASIQDFKNNLCFKKIMHSIWIFK